MRTLTIDGLIEIASEVYGVDVTPIHRKAEYLLRFINKGGDIIPPVIEEEIFRYLGGGYAPRRHSSSRLFESAAEIPLLTQSESRYEELATVRRLLEQQNIRRYLTQQKSESMKSSGHEI